MNKIYRLKFSKRLNALVAVSELTRGCDHSTEKGSEKPARMKVRHLALKPLSAILLSLGVTSIPQSVLASGLQGMDVVHGTATMQVDGNKTIIRNSVDAIINWKQFNIDQNEMVQFLQENNNSAVFNRVTSNQISQLKGILDSNGQVFLINPNGITIGKDAIINTNGFTASTLDISNENIKARNFTLEQTKDKALAEIVNHGLITVGKDGSVNLIGGKVKNEGVISVNGGSISLLAGQKITISDIINPTITYSIAAPENEAVNLGDIFAKGGNINVRAATIRNQGKLSADSVSKDKSGNIILSAKEGEAEIGGVISAQNQQAKGGKLMITGDKVTLKTGAVIDLSGKEGGETYLGGDERGEGKNGIQLAKKTSLEKGSTINVSGKEKGGRAIVWGDIALINGNINAQGSDIAETGGFVETSGHDLFIKDNAIVDAKEWLLDPENVSIDAPQPGRDNNNSETDEYTTEQDNNSSVERKRNNQSKTTLTNSTLEAILARGSFVNITANKKITVNSAINLSNGSLALYAGKGGIEINEDITSDESKGGANLTITSRDWIDIHKNITLGQGFLNITTSDSVAFEKRGDKSRNAADAKITAQGTIRITGEGKNFRLNNVSLNGTGNGLSILSVAGNLSHKLDGEINVSGNVTINQTAPTSTKFWNFSHDSYWNVSALNLEGNAKFTFIKRTESPSTGSTTAARSSGGVFFNGMNGNMTFNVGAHSKVLFNLKPTENTNNSKPLPIQFKANITATGGGSVSFDMYANLAGRGAELKMDEINISGGTNLTFQSHVRKDNAFTISKDLVINATGSNFTLEQSKDNYADGFPGRAINSTKNITISGGNVTLGGQNSSSNITGNITINKGANVSLKAYNNGVRDYRSRTLTLGNLTVQGNLSLVGTNAEITGDLSVSKDATFKGNTNENLNITGNFTNNGTAEINITQGVVNLGDITNDGKLNITTRAKNGQKSIIRGNITNKKGDLNITDNKGGAEIQIGGNISQKEGNLTISSDTINITNQIKIKKGVNGEDSNSDTASIANLTIKTKELKLTGDLNISGFDKAEIVAKNGSDLTIGNGSDSGSANAKKVTFNNVKDSNISANDHNVTLNSKVETSGSNGRAESNSDNDTGLTINAKNVTVNNNITSLKAVNITASENVTTKADTTINATTGNVNITTQTGNIKGGIESSSGSVTLTATGDTLAVGNISGNTVSVTANSGTLTTKADSTIKGTGSVTTLSQSGDIGGTISGKTVSVTATTDSLTVKGGAKINATEGTATLTASSGKLTTEANSAISGANGVTASSQSGDISGTISGKTVSVTATTDSLTVKGGAKINATEGTATLTASSGKLTTEANSAISGANGVTASSQSGDISGTISGKTVSVTATTDSLTVKGGAKINATEGAATLTATKGTLTTVKGSNIDANKGTLVINAKDATLNGDASGDRTEVNAVNASGSGNVTAATSSSVNITGDLNTINGLNIISKNGRNTVVLKGAEIDVKYIQPGVASANEVIEAKRALEKVKDLSDEERETLAKLGVSAVRFIEPNNTITVNTQNEFTTRPSSQVTISEGKACFSSGNGAAVCTNVADDGQQ
ncbi:filamentous hemagglutinin family N-terminal domain protein [Haemophilus influenzae]|uniref:two-partner secretion domain-containing protein n=4 Tax=Haemophilus influenzae TaxID=727 RepID=UPI0001545864|nr:filamentous hemagglutinin N-terminal domain-containing protein [Haemophilus influenzae]ABQ98487.1 HMW2A, high molecular weight adhesin 2 [Haemophilus influenzae PittEE]WCN73531.1 filamentous hemagglutinin family N-terminal domain protein [Haemophilus influenzae]WCN75500.1 filamentous hemagglutinin family N-terminal domain protein [Haemophilus influenzae]WCO84405.1 filamentous hemagglutinin family N-terminal domain protein [Haemophilus influenzae]WCO86102.1 filamentous hemagglutinin family N